MLQIVYDYNNLLMTSFFNLRFKFIVCKKFSSNLLTLLNVIWFVMISCNLI